MQSQFPHDTMEDIQALLKDGIEMLSGNNKKRKRVIIDGLSIPVDRTSK